MVRTSFASAGSGDIRCRIWEPVKNAKGIVQIVHGIAEHSGRYGVFAEYLTDNGYISAAEDHMGHGETASQACPLGCIRGGWNAMTADVHGLTLLLKARHPGLPIFLLGHSMGSFLVRTCLYTYPAERLDGAILLGTAWQPMPILAAGRALARHEIRRLGADRPSPVLYDLVFGSYLRQFPGETVPDAWICSDQSVVDRYMEDPLCGFVPSCALLKAMLDGMTVNQAPANLSRMPKDLPVCFIAGGRDPVGNNGKGVKRCLSAFRTAGMRDTVLELRPEVRHEVLNERDKKQTWAWILSWLEARIKHHISC